MADRGGSCIQLEKLLKQFLQIKAVTMTNLIVDQMLKIVLIMKMTQLMKKMTWKMTALFCPVQTLARMLKLSQMTKKVIVLPLKLCRKFCFMYLASQKIYLICLYYMYILYCRHTCYRFWPTTYCIFIFARATKCCIITAFYIQMISWKLDKRRKNENWIWIYR